MKKEKYEKPAMQVVELKVQTQLLAGSATVGNNLQHLDQFTTPSDPDPFDF